MVGRRDDFAFGAVDVAPAAVFLYGGAVFAVRQDAVVIRAFGVGQVEAARRFLSGSGGLGTCTVGSGTGSGRVIGGVRALAAAAVRGKGSGVGVVGCRCAGGGGGCGCRVVVAAAVSAAAVGRGVVFLRDGGGFLRFVGARAFGAVGRIHQDVQQRAAVNGYARFDGFAFGVNGAGNVQRQGFAAAFGRAVVAQVVVALAVGVVAFGFFFEVGVFRPAAKEVQRVPLQAVDFRVDAWVFRQVCGAHQHFVHFAFGFGVPNDNVRFVFEAAAVVGVVVEAAEHVVAVAHDAAVVFGQAAFVAQRVGEVRVAVVFFDVGARGDDVVVDFGVFLVPGEAAAF